MEPSSCEVCQGSNFEEIDGFYFCQNCGTQSQSQRVFETDEFDTILNATRQTKICQKKGEGQKATKKDRTYTKADYLLLRAQSEAEFPRYLRQCGFRIATFTKVLCYYGNILVRDFDLDEVVLMRIRLILQEYLRNSGVAFSESELAGDDGDKFSVLQRKTRVEINEENRAQIREIKKKKEKERRPKKKVVTASEALSQFMDADETVQDEENIEEEDADNLDQTLHQIDVVRLVSTNLSRKAVVATGNVLLDIDLVLVILYMACITSGATWILLSDITRWYREGRFPITKSQRRALTFCVGMEQLNEKSTDLPAKCRLWGRGNHGVEPLFESYRVFHSMIQIVGLPKELVLRPDFTQILLRYVYNLNLPYSFMKQLKVLEKLLPTDCERSLRRSRSEFYFNSSVLADFLRKPVSTGYGSISFFRDYFLREGSAGFDKFRSNLRTKGQHTMIFSDEVKAVALILFALKLMFGLDDVREFALKPKTRDKERDTENFELAPFLLQLRLRMACWKGALASKVLSRGYAAQCEKQSIFSSPSFIGDHRFRRNQIRSRDFEFSGCVPSFDIFSARDKIFFKNFADDFMDTITKDFLGKEAMYAPLRHTAIKNQSWLNEFSRTSNINELLDLKNVEIFFKSNSDLSMDYCEATESSPVPYRDRLTNDTDCCAMKESKWRSLFPSSAAYQVYPRSENLRMILDVNDSFDEAEFLPTLIFEDSEMMMETAKPCFSQSFEFLLNELSTMVGEPAHMVYCMLVMLEMMLFEKSRVHNLELSVLRGEPMQLGNWEIFAVEGTSQSTRSYAAHNRKVEEGTVIHKNSLVPVPLSLGLPLLYWKSW